MKDILFALWFFIPAGLANAIPVVMAGRNSPFKNWSTPMDFGHSYKGVRIFGDNKTWRGLISGVIVACLIAVAQYHVWLPPQLADKSLGFMVVLGGLLGFGALLGDSVESFLKRRFGHKAGESWFPYDQTDYILGGLLFSLLLAQLSWHIYALVLVLWFGIHVVTVYVFYKLGIREKPI